MSSPPDGVLRLLQSVPDPRRPNVTYTLLTLNRIAALCGCDDYAGLSADRKVVLPGVAWRRYKFHLQQNAVEHCPLDQGPRGGRRVSARGLRRQGPARRRTSPEGGG